MPFMRRRASDFGVGAAREERAAARIGFQHAGISFRGPAFGGMLAATTCECDEVASTEVPAKKTIAVIETEVIAESLSDKNGDEGNEKLLQACDLRRRTLSF
ncbi:MAG TPA: hypothetical protein VGY56_00920 [Verrucomicrobiae bacterium]|nr:hypothetical protein [Verrucomicrobiae bacterium]